MRFILSSSIANFSDPFIHSRNFQLHAKAQMTRFVITARSSARKAPEKNLAEKSNYKAGDYEN